MTYDSEAFYESEQTALPVETFAFEGEEESPFNETEETDLAAELLGVGNEAELEQFLGGLFKKAASVVGKVVKNPIGQQLAGLAKGAIRKALPGLGATVGGFLVPGAGAALGSQLAGQAGNLLGLELEGLSTEDQEFEVAKRLVRLLGADAKHAAQAAAGAESALAIARKALARAARQHAPGLARNGAAPKPSPAPAQSHESSAPWMSGGEFEDEQPFNEIQEMELAAELVGVSSEEELDQFIGDFLKKAASAAGKALHTPLGQQVGGLFKGAIKKVLPKIGSAVGIDGGTASQLVDQAGQILGLELEGLSAEDQEFEAAKQLVRFGADAVKNAVNSPNAPTQAVAQAAQRHAPGLLKNGASASPQNTGGNSTCGCGSHQSGRWIRRGAKIILMGA